MNNSKKLLTLSKICQRQLSTSAEEVTPRFKKLKDVQEKIGADDGVPMYLKGGFGDRILYLTTFGLTFAGIGESLHVCYNLTFGKNN